jgi:hypothetical protein
LKKAKFSMLYLRFTADPREYLPNPFPSRHPVSE